MTVNNTLTNTAKGTITASNGNPLSKLTIRAYDMDLRRRVLLGEATTNSKGAYLITYTTQELARVEKSTADILIEVCAADERVVGQSDIQFNAASETTVDMVIAADKYLPPSEFDDMAATLDPILVRSGMTLTDLEEDATHRDLTFITGETGLDKTKLTWFALAHRLSAKSDVAAALWYAALVYKAIFTADNEVKGLEEQCNRILTTIPTVKAESLQRALEKATQNNRIAATFPIEAAVQQFKAFAVVQTNRVETIAKNALILADVHEDKHTDFISLLLEHPNFEAAKQTLADDKRFTHKEKTDLSTVFRLAALAGNDIDLVKKLKTAIGTRGEKGIRQLARKSTTEWTTLLGKETGTRSLLDTESISDVASPLLNFGEMPKTATHIAAQFAATYPTAAFTGALSRHVTATKRQQNRQVVKNRTLIAAEDTPLPTESGQVSTPTASTQVLANVLPFLNQYDHFDLLEHNIDTFFEQDVAPKASKTRGLLAEADTETAQLKNDLKTVQRVFRLQPNFEATKSLLENDLHSSQKIYSMGEQTFVRDMKDAAGFTEQTARTTFHKAANTHAAVLTMIAEWRDAQDAQNIAALKTPSVAEAAPMGERGLLPNLETLFGSNDVCECDQCRSVLSPSAYLMDTITFLKNRKATTIGKSAWDVLKNRRPDIGFLEMSCDNSNVPLPYIDIVCEVLEEQVAFIGSDGMDNGGLQLTDAAWAFTLPSSIEMSLTKGLASADLKTAFANNNIILTDKAVVSDKRTLTDRTTYDCWIVRDTAISLKIVKRPADFAVAVLRQTRGTADWLAATPQYVNPQVYSSKGLASAVYPFNLPFDLFLEETRALLSNTGVQRWELMDTLRGSVWNVNTASEYFNFSPSFGDATPATQFRFWGALDNIELPMGLTNLNRFLKKTGLEYTDVLRLLDTKWVNPTGTLAISHSDTSCDTISKNIFNLDVNAFDRILKILRLSKLTGWAFWEMDLVLRHPKLGNGAFSPNTLIPMWRFAELKKRLNLSTEQALALLGDINTETHFSDAYAPRIDGLYQAVFLNIQNAPPTAFAVSNITAAVPTALISANKIALQAALQIKEADLEALLNLKRPDGTLYLAANAPLSLSNISFLYRNVLLSRAFNMPSVSAWASFVPFMGYMTLDNQAIPAPFVHTWLTQENIDSVAQAAAFFNAGIFNIAELNYVGRNDRTATIVPKDADIVLFLTKLITTGQTISDADQKVFVVQQFSEKLGLSLPLAESILTNVFFGATKGGAIVPFLNKNQTVPVTAANFADGFEAYHWLQRVALVVQKFNISLFEMQILNDQQTTNSLFAQLLFAPLAQTITIPSFSDFKKVLDFNRYYANDKISFFGIQAKIKTNSYATLAPCAADMALFFNAKATDIAFLLTDWAIPVPTSVANSITIGLMQRLEKALTFAQKLNLPAVQLKAVSDIVGYEQLPTLLKQSLRPVYAEKQWLDLLKIIQDALRERKREALVSFLLNQSRGFAPFSPTGKWDNPNDLYAYYLMDVEMTSAQSTSRIVQAAGFDSIIRPTLYDGT